MTEHNNDAGSLAEANGRQARFWADHFAEVEKANRAALSAHHKPGHTVAELITALVGEVERLRTSVIRAQTARAMEGTEAVKLGDKLLEADDEAGQLTHELAAVRASREAWAIEADRLDVIATAARYYVRPDDCDGADCDHDDDVCVHMEERHATADDAIAAANVKWLEAERERLSTLCAKGNDFVLDVAEALGMPASTSNADLIATLVGELAEVREFGNDAMNSAHTKAQEIAKWVEGYGKLSADNKRLTRERDEARAEVSLLERCYDAVKERAERAEARPAIPADATYVESLKDDLALAGDEASAFRNLLSSIWLYVSWRSVTKRLTTEQKELWADAIEASGDPDEPTEVDRWWRDVAPVSGSDTTESGGDQ